MTATLTHPLPPCEILQQTLSARTVEHPDGRKLPLTAAVSPPNAAALYRTIVERKPKLVIEIGMAYGVSALAILAGLHENGSGKLISIDPYINWPTGELVALHQIRRAGFAERHSHRRQPSHEALPQLLAEGHRADLVYIDGYHTFDYAFVDFFYADKLIAPGGLIVFNDAGWRSVHKVIKAMRTHRRYREIDVGLPKCYHGRNPLVTLLKRLEGRSTYDRYFEKVEEWQPPYDFFRRF